MTIKEFNETVKIGSVVVHKGTAYKVDDIDRREHTAIINTWRCVRCSELEFPTGEEKFVETKKKKQKK